MSVTIDVQGVGGYVAEDAWEQVQERAGVLCSRLLSQEDSGQVLGWRKRGESAIQIDEIQQKAQEVRQDADVFVIVGVGGSNQAARAMIEAMTGRKGPQILYLGNTLSPHYIQDILARMEGKSVYLDVIAKNFETLEPGSHFRILRRWMEARYSKEEMARRIIVTGTAGSRLEEIARENGYLFLQFPVPVGGRYSAFTPVCLFPIAVAGLDIGRYLSGMEQAARACKEEPRSNPASQYAAARNLLYQNGYDIEMLASFEPRLMYLAKWWVQLFGESEGKEGKGIFPACAIYSEDLHAIGQYMQDGRRNLMETFVSVRCPGGSVVIASDPGFGDGFDYLDGMDFDQLNKAAEEATRKAHLKGGVPCLRFMVEEVSEEAFGELFYYFMVACAVSGSLMGVDPFNQEGVEEYKRSMFKALGK